MSISCCCIDMWLDLPMLILLTRFSQQGSLMSGEGQRDDYAPRGCSRLIDISRIWGRATHLPGGWPDGGPWSTDGKWMQRRAAPAHAPIPKRPHLQINDQHSLVSLNYYTTAVIGFFYPLEVVMLLMFIVIFSQSLYLKYNVFLHRTYFDSMMMLHKLCEKVAK